MPWCLGTSASVRAMSMPRSATWPPRRPHLLAVDDPLVAVLDRRGLQAGEVGAGAGLAEELAPGLLAGDDGRTYWSICSCVPWVAMVGAASSRPSPPGAPSAPNSAISLLHATRRRRATGPCRTALGQRRRRPAGGQPLPPLADGELGSQFSSSQAFTSEALRGVSSSVSVTTVTVVNDGNTSRGRSVARDDAPPHNGPDNRSDVKLSVLDLAPVPAGSTAAQALANCSATVSAAWLGSITPAGADAQGRRRYGEVGDQHPGGDELAIPRHVVVFGDPVAGCNRGARPCWASSDRKVRQCLGCRGARRHRSQIEHGELDVGSIVGAVVGEGHRPAQRFDPSMCSRRSLRSRL